MPPPPPALPRGSSYAAGPCRMQGMCFAPLLPARRPNATYKRIVIGGGGGSSHRRRATSPPSPIHSHRRPPSIAPPEEGRSRRMPPVPLQPAPSRSRRRARPHRGPAGAAPLQPAPSRGRRKTGAMARRRGMRCGDAVSAAPERLRSRARHGAPRVPPCAARGRPPAGAASDALVGVEAEGQAAAPPRLDDAAQHLDDLFGRHVGRERLRLGRHRADVRREDGTVEPREAVAGGRLGLEHV